MFQSMVGGAGMAGVVLVLVVGRAAAVELVASFSQHGVRGEMRFTEEQGEVKVRSFSSTHSSSLLPSPYHKLTIIFTSPLSHYPSPSTVITIFPPLAQQECNLILQLKTL